MRQLWRTARSQFAAKKVEIFINDKPYLVDSNMTIFQAAKENGITIPRFCYHERLKIAGNCRMCLVEVAKTPKPTASCCSNVMPAMRVYTESEATRLARGGVMEFILANHPLDCPICDQGGQCDLQNHSIDYGYMESRFDEEKRAVEDKNFGPLVVTHMNRCIHCTRCIRFSEEIGGYHDLGTTGRGRATEIGTYVDKMLQSELSGNIADVCPVGALNHGPTAYSVRSYEVKRKQTIDVLETLGAHIDVEYKGQEVMRVNPFVHEEINEEWLSDKSRNSYDGLKRQRLTVPLQRMPGGDFQELSWEKALALAAEKITQAKGDEVCGSVGELSDLETLTALRDFVFRLGGECFEFRHNHRLEVDSTFRANFLMNSRIQGVEDTDHILLVGCNLRADSPLLNARVLKAIARNQCRVSSIGAYSDLTYEQHHLGSNARILEEILEGSHPVAQELEKARLPMLILGQDAVTRADGAAIQALCRRLASKYGVISPEQRWNGYNLLLRHSGVLNALELGLNLRRVCASPRVLFLLGDNHLEGADIPRDCFVVYVGSHGDQGAAYADLVLPGATFMEKEGTFLNLEGRVQQAHRVVDPPGYARPDWEVFRALSEFCGVTLPYSTLEELRHRMSELHPALLKYGTIERTIFGKFSERSAEEGAVLHTPLQDLVDNYYMTDAVTRASVVMAKCSLAFNEEKYANFKRLIM